MKRALFVIVAALVVLLAYPSTQSIAALEGPGVTGPTVASSAPGGTPLGVDSGSGDGSDGDADGLSGIDSKKTLKGTQLTIEIEREWVLLRMWWNLFMWIR
jgi:hypothetical protein